MRAVLTCLLFASPAAADGPPVVVYASPARPPATPPAGVVVKVTEYLLVDGKRVVIAEWTAPVAHPAVPARSGCPTCGPACRCGPACGCDASSWLATCAAAPRIVATGPPPPPVFLPGAPVPYTAAAYAPPVYTRPVYYRPMPQYRPVFRSDACGPGGCPGPR